jgi:hypothetical protein
MKVWEKWGLHLGAALAGVTGVGYGYVRYFCGVQGEFGPEPHPWQGALQHLHVLSVPLLVFALGLAARGHAAGMLQHHVTRGRRTGLALLSLIVPMVFGGYAIQIVTQPSTRAALAWIHGVASLAFVVAYGAHWKKRHLRERARAPNRLFAL